MFYQIFSILFILDFVLFQVIDRRDIILERSKIFGFVGITLILVFDYFYFHYKNRYEKILDNYKKLEKEKKVLYNILSIVYMVLVIILNIYSIYSFKNNIHWW